MPYHRGSDCMTGGAGCMWEARFRSSPTAFCIVLLVTYLNQFRWNFCAICVGIFSWLQGGLRRPKGDSFDVSRADRTQNRFLFQIVRQCIFVGLFRPHALSQMLEDSLHCTALLRSRNGLLYCVPKRSLLRAADVGL